MDSKTKLFSECTIFDTETTSLDFREAEVIQFATADYILARSGEGWKVTFDSFYKPSKPISPHVSAICFITNKMVEDRPSFEDELDYIQSLFDKTQYIVAHNAFYDEKVLARYDLKLPPMLCTMRMAKKIYESNKSVEAYNLSYLRYALNLPISDDIIAHRADQDSLVTAALFEHLVNAAVQDWHVDEKKGPLGQQLVKWLEEPIIVHTMPFGKHKGKPMQDVPLDYWQWALETLPSLNENAMEYDRDFAASVAHAVGKIFEKS